MFERRLLFVSGKGGVGKSAVTAALAIRAARLGKQVLAIALTEGVGLASHLGVDSLEYQPIGIRPGLHALAVNRADALEEYARLQAHLPRAAPAGPLISALRAVIDAIPGVREVVSVGKPVFEVWRGDWDLVIVDAAPLGQLLSYLRAPATVQSLVPTGRVRDQAKRMQDLLRDTTATGLILVSTLEELPVAETLETMGDIASEPTIDIMATVTNRALDALPFAPNLLPTGPHRDAAMLHSVTQAGQAEMADRLSAKGPRLPYLFGVHTAGEVAARLADEWPEP